MNLASPVRKSITELDVSRSVRAPLGVTADAISTRWGGDVGTRAYRPNLLGSWC